FLRRRAKGWVSKIAQKRARAAVPSPDLLRLGERRRSEAPTTSRRASSLANALTRRVAAAFSSAEINILCGAEIVGFDRQRLAQGILPPSPQTATSSGDEAAGSDVKDNVYGESAVSTRGARQPA